MSDNNSFLVFSGTKTRYLAEKICASLGVPLGNLVRTQFSDGEFVVSYEQSIRGKDVFLVQSTFPNSDNLMELLLMIDAAKRASARQINAVIPYFGWARQDRKDKPRVSIGAKLIADLLSTAGIDRLITMDLHADQIQGFFDIPVDHLYASGVFIPYIQSLRLKDMVIGSPDVGGSKRANSYAKYFGCPLVLCNKTRARANVVDSMQIIGDVKGKDVIIVDDMISSGESMIDVATELKKRKAKRIFVVATFGLFTNGLEKFDEAVEKGIIYRVVTTNLTYQTPELLSRPYYINCDMSKYIAYIIDTLNHDCSISGLLDPYERIHKVVNKYNNGEL